MNLYNDTVIEESTPSKPKKSQYVLLAVTVVFAVISALAVVVSFIAALLLIALIIAAIAEANNLHLDYDYTYVNGSIDFAKVIKKERRKHICSVESTSIIVMAPSGYDELKSYDKVKVIDCSSHFEDAKNYELVYRDDKKDVICKVIFNPSDNFIKAIRRFNPRNVYM